MSKKKILIVEDEQDYITFLTTLLQDNGYDTITANDGEKGMKSLLDEKPDLVTLDLVMPNETGVRFLRKVKKDDALKNVPIVIVSGLTDFKTFIKKCGPVPEPEAFVDKPIDEQRLLDEIKKLIG